MRHSDNGTCCGAIAKFVVLPEIAKNFHQVRFAATEKPKAPGKKLKASGPEAGKKGKALEAFVDGDVVNEEAVGLEET